MNDPVVLLRLIGKALPVLVLLRLLDCPLTAAQVGEYLQISANTARSYLRSLSKLTDPPLAAALGNGCYVALPGAQLVLSPENRDSNFALKLSSLNTERESERELNSLTDSLSRTQNLRSDPLLEELYRNGVYQRTAQELLNKHPPEVIRSALDYYADACKRGIARGPGYLVRSIREQWQLPSAEKSGSSYITGRYAEFIEH